jgi:hypothetical protein
MGKPVKKRNSLSLNKADPASDLLQLCDRVVAWVEDFETLCNPINRAEADGGSEAVFKAAMEQEVQVLLEINELATKLPDMHATNQLEIKGKQRALNALTSNDAWERKSLYNLRISIERDQAEIYAVLISTLPAQAQRSGWQSRLTGPTAAAEG